MIECMLDRARGFAASLNAAVPVFMAPMAGASPVPLAAAVANAGGMGACGALLLSPAEIRSWAAEFRRESEGSFQMNLWVPDPPPVRDAAAEERQCLFLSAWGPAVSAELAGASSVDFEAQCGALLEARPKVISSIMGLFSADFVAEMKRRGIAWFATATTVKEARAAERAGADAVVAQGAEAGGHRGAFDAAAAETEAVGLFALLPQMCDAVRVPVIAAGGIADGRSVAAALLLGASAVQVGTGLLRCPEAKIHRAYSERLAVTEAHETRLTRAFSGRAGRAVRTRYVEAAAAEDAPAAAPYPIQRALTRGMREEAARAGDAERMQMWAGQAARYARAEPAGVVVQRIWREALECLRYAGC